MTAPAGLHLIHAAPSKGHSLDIGGVRWRPVDGGTLAEKRAQAYRMAFCWNMAEGIPMAALRAGCVAQFYRAVDDLLAAIDKGDGVAEVAARVRAAKQAHDIDPTPVECATCYPTVEEAPWPR